MKTVVGGNITTEEEATAESHQPHVLLPPSVPQNCSEPEPRTLQVTPERNPVEKCGDCVTLSPACVRATKVESNYGSVIKCVDTHTRKLDSSGSSLT